MIESGRITRTAAQLKLGERMKDAKPRYTLSKKCVGDKYDSCLPWGFCCWSFGQNEDGNRSAGRVGEEDDEAGASRAVRFQAEPVERGRYN